MNQLNIASTISTHRRQKSLTQEGLASFMGVTKASVSKWETGSSFPDIFMLPRLASFFNISIDQLIGYEPQMTEADIRKLYKELSIEFTIKPYEEVITRCREIAIKYYSCFPLLLQIGVLYINYGYYTIKCLDEEQKAAIVEEAKGHFTRVKDLSQDVDLKMLALHLIATCELLLNNPDEVINLFEGVKNKMPPNNEILLSQAYIMTGRVKEAKAELQRCVYEAVMKIVGIIPSYMSLCTDDAKHFDEIYMRVSETIKLWNVKELYPPAVMPFYLNATAGYVAIGETDKALDILDEYTKIVTGNIFPLAIKGDDFFSLVAFPIDDLPYGSAETPRDEKTIRQSLVDSIATNPAFEPLHDNFRFVNMVKRVTNSLL